MNEKGQRASERRRERSGDELLEEPAGEATAIHTVGGQWLGDDDALPGALATEQEGGLSSAFDEVQITGELESGGIVAASRSIETKKPLEETAFSKRPRVPDPDGARLMVIAGPDKGRGQDLIFAEMIIGRSDRADMVLRDGSVSREHFALRWSQDNFHLVDLGSEAGTRVNGEEVARFTLNFGDEIELGETILRFMPGDLAPAERPPVAPEGTIKVQRPDGTAIVRATRGAVGPRKRTVPFWLAISALGLGILVLTAYVVEAYRKGEIKIGQDPGMIALLEQARAALDAKDYEQAKMIAETVLQSRPKDKDALEIVRRADLALGLGQTLEDIRQALSQGQLDKAEALLKALPVDSDEAQIATKLCSDAKEEQRSAQLDAARRLIDQGAYAAAELLLEQHDQRWPGDDEADSLRYDIAARREAATDQAHQAKQALIHASLRPASAAFAKGQLDLARERLAKLRGGPNAAAAQTMRAQIDRFAALFAQGQRFHQNKQPREGLRVLDEAAQIAGKIAPRGSAFSQKLNGWRCDLQYQLGVRALAAGQQCQAFSFFAQAWRSNRKDQKSKAQLERLSQKAEQVLNQAKALRHSNPAQAKNMVRTVQCLAQPRTALHTRLKKFVTQP